MNSNSHPLTVPALSFSLDSFQLRVIMINGEIHFVGSDACALLGVDKTQIRRLDDDEKGVYSIQTLGGVQEVVVITESGFYSLVLSSRKPDAKRVKRWVTHDVLPSIRKTGGYSEKKQVPPDRQKRLCRSLMLDIERCNDKFARDGLLVIASAAFSDAGLKLPDVKLLRPLQMLLTPEGGTV